MKPVIALMITALVALVPGCKDEKKTPETAAIEPAAAASEGDKASASPESQPASAPASQPTNAPASQPASAPASQPASAPAKATGNPKNCGDREALAVETRKAGTPVLAGLGGKAAETVAQKDLIDGADLYDGKRVRIEGPIVGICQGMGCWAGLRGPKGSVINLKVKDGDVDFRKLAQLGQYAIGEGTFTKVGPHGVQVKIAGAMIGPTVCQ